MSDYDVYTALTDSPDTFKQVRISAYIPFVTDADIALGYIERYFVQRLLDPTGEIVEITRNSHDALRSNPMYRLASLTWRVSGPLEDKLDSGGIRSYTGVLTANRLSLELAMKTMPALNTKLINLKQYWVGY